MKTIIFISFLLILTGCNSMAPLEHYTFEKEGLKLPYLLPEANVEIIKNAIHFNSVETSKNPVYEKLSYTKKQKSYDQEPYFDPDPRVDDFIQLYLRQLKKHIEIDSLNSMGIIQLNLLSFSQTNANALRILNLWTLGIPALLGSPVNIVEVEMTLSLNICNSKNEIIEIYTGEGYAKEYLALYYGYGQDVYSVALLKSFSSGMKTAFEKIKNDQKQLNEKLK